MRYLIAALVLGLASPAAAQSSPDGFATGPVFAAFGPHAPVDGLRPFPAGFELSHAFDVADRADAGTRNRGFESAARFVNMHAANGAANGVDPAHIRIAVVVHGRAVLDLLSDEAVDLPETGPETGAGQGKLPNGSAAMVREMRDHGVRFIVCGQSAAGHGVTADQLIPGVEMALSAMTAHALLQQQGYTVNPF